MIFTSAGELQKYLRENMPPLEAGTLAEEEAWALTLYVLKQANISVPADLGPENAAKVKVP